MHVQQKMEEEHLEDAIHTPKQEKQSPKPIQNSGTANPNKDGAHHLDLGGRHEVWELYGKESETLHFFTLNSSSTSQNHHFLHFLPPLKPTNNPLSFM